MAQSIKASGVIQPIVVRQVGDQFQIIAGERRWRAARQAGLLRVPVVVRDVAAGEERSLLEMALIENIQRENLNPIDEALAFRRLADDFQLTQEAIAAAVGKGDQRVGREHAAAAQAPAGAARRGGDLPEPCPWDTRERFWRYRPKPTRCASRGT